MAKPQNGNYQQYGAAPGNEHVVPWMLGRLTRTAPQSSLTEEELLRGARHLLTCKFCSTSLAALNGALALSEDADGLVNSAQDPDPSDAELATYAALRAEAGEPAAAQRYPTIAAHMLRCQTCQEAVQEIEEMLGAFVTENAPSIIDKRAPAHAHSWRHVSASVRRLLEPYHVMVRQWSVRITSALDQPQIATVYAGPVRFRTRGAAAQQLEQSFAVDLRDDATVLMPWIHTRIELKALSARRVSGKIIATLQAFPDDLGEPATGIEWQIEQVGSAGEATPLRSGMTDADGQADFFVRGYGDYLLTIHTEEREWVIPFSLMLDTDAVQASGSHGTGDEGSL